MRLFRWEEPHITGANCVCTITREQLLKHVLSLPCVDKDAKDEDLIREFCIVNWAWEIEKENV